MENISEYYQHYCQHRSITATSKHFHKCTKYLSKWFRDAGYLFPLPDFNKKLTYNENYFEAIDSDAKAYLLGFIFADGTIAIRDRPNGNPEYAFRMNLQIGDIGVLEFMKKELGYNGNLSTIKGKEFVNPQGKTYTRQDQALISISSRKLVGDLVGHGVIPRKSYNEISIPSLDPSLYGAFVRGYFDGNGYAGYQTSGSVNARIECSSLNFITQMKGVLEVNGVACSLRQNKRGTYLITVPMAYQPTFYTFMYKNASFCFDRKRIKLAPTR